MSKSEAKIIVKKYAQALYRQGFPLQAIFLYGSYANGNSRLGSDIDVCVVSNRFAGGGWDKYERQLWQLRREVDLRIEPIGMSAAELSGMSPLSEEIRRTGIKIRQ